jgi:hypothetical protein
MHNKQKEIAATLMYKTGRAFYQRAACKGNMALKQQEALKLCRAASTMKKKILLTNSLSLHQSKKITRYRFVMT